MATKRKDGRLCQKITVDGEAYYFYGKTQKELNQKILAFREKKRTGRTFSEVADDWQEEAFPDLAVQTVKVYKPALERLEKAFGNEPIIGIKTADIAQFLNSLFKEGFAYKTIANAKIVCSQVFNYAVNNGEIDANPCRDATIPKGAKKSRRTAATSEEEQIIRQLPPDAWLFPFFALYTGMRRGEILALEWTDINFFKNTISVTKSLCHDGNAPLIKPPKTEAGNRIVPLLVPLKERLLKEKNRNGYIFSDDGGETPLTKGRFEQEYKVFRKSLGVKCTAHQLRHSFATIAFEAGVPAKSVQEILGHRQLSTTMDTYTDFRSQAIEKAAAILNGDARRNA